MRHFKGNKNTFRYNMKTDNMVLVANTFSNKSSLNIQ